MPPDPTAGMKSSIFPLGLLAGFLFCFTLIKCHRRPNSSTIALSSPRRHPDVILREPCGFCGKIIWFNARPHLLFAPRTGWERRRLAGQPGKPKTGTRRRDASAPSNCAPVRGHKSRALAARGIPATGSGNGRWTIPVWRRRVRPIPARVFQKDGGRFSLSANMSFARASGRRWPQAG